MAFRGPKRQDLDDSVAFIKRLEEVASNFRSRAAFALAAGIPASSLQSYFEGSEPTRATLFALADAGRVSLEWLARGRGYKDPHPQVPDGYLAIPFYDIRKAGGYVYPLVSEDVVDFTYLKLEWFSYQGIEPGKLFLIEVTDSRVAEISNGDFAVVDAAWALARYPDEGDRSGNVPCVSTGKAIHPASREQREWRYRAFGFTRHIG